MKVTIKGDSKEIAALVAAIQERQVADNLIKDSDRESLIRQYEYRLAKLKSDA